MPQMVTMTTIFKILYVQSHYSLRIAYANFRKHMQISEKLIRTNFYPASRLQAITNVCVAYS